ncbi:hypothetical protein EYF80_042822 [Liparis tanakae]|uniref:Uncharacterized protein n=1 Tax=Liparis tanakae TaxID=230148 RepID=A0A4Z2G249_9TELE|nr:hypothetical protein EYF80_042822 [Liparis tanakae]
MFPSLGGCVLAPEDRHEAEAFSSEGESEGSSTFCGPNVLMDPVLLHGEEQSVLMDPVLLHGEEQSVLMDPVLLHGEEQSVLMETAAFLPVEKRW